MKKIMAALLAVTSLSYCDIRNTKNDKLNNSDTTGHAPHTLVYLR